MLPGQDSLSQTDIVIIIDYSSEVATKGGFGCLAILRETCDARLLDEWEMTSSLGACVALRYDPLPVRHACNYATSAELAFFYDELHWILQKHRQQRCSFRHALTQI